MLPFEANNWPRRLLKLGLDVQTQIAHMVRTEFRHATNRLTKALAEESGDRIYTIDREVETTIRLTVESWVDECGEILLIAEGMGTNGRTFCGDPGREPVWQVIIDPIDGTRMLMYDKRSAWFLAAVCPHRIDGTFLHQSVASVMVELPISKQGFADSFVATGSDRTVGMRHAVSEDSPPSIESGVPFPVQPAQAHNLVDGFATVLSFFPGTRTYAAELAERIADRCGVMTSLPTVFDDQYISTGGLMTQLMTGRDRFCLDLRPQFNRIAGRPNDHRFIESHPYDLAGFCAALSSGVVLTDGFGKPLQVPLDVTTGVDWCGYANINIQSMVEPIVQEWLTEHGIADG